MIIDCHVKKTALLAVAVTALSAATVSADAASWQNVVPTEAPGCAKGAPFSFWVRAADPKKLAVVFPGGGACWNDKNCNQENEYSNYDAEAGLDKSPEADGGIFDFSNAENPLSDRSFIVIPTCNGDVFLGDNVATYHLDDTHTYKIRHTGFENAMSAINWARNTLSDVEDITVMGWSAGAIPSPLYTHILAQSYPDARVSHVADGAGGYRVEDELDEAFENWGTANVFRQVAGFEDLADGRITFEDIYVRAAQLNPEINFHQLNIAHDYTQEFFLTALGIEDPDVFERIKATQSYINQNVDNFRTYTVGGNAENIIGGYYDGFLNHSLQNNGRPYVVDRLYSYKSDDVPVLVWIKAAIAHGDVKNVSCQNCDAPQYTVEFEDED